jgi:hypothetical protein
MEASRFDTLTRLLSRRRTLASLAGLSLAIRPDPAAVAAGKHHKPKAKRGRLYGFGLKR